MGFKCPNCLDDKTQKLSIFYENNTNPKTMETNSLLAEKFLPPNLEIWRPTFVFFITFITVNIISDYSMRRILGIDNLKTFAGKTEGVTSLFLSVFIAIIVSSLVKKRNKKKEELYKEKLFFGIFLTYAILVVKRSFCRNVLLKILKTKKFLLLIFNYFLLTFL